MKFSGNLKNFPRYRVKWIISGNLTISSIIFMDPAPRAQTNHSPDDFLHLICWRYFSLLFLSLSLCSSYIGRFRANKFAGCCCILQARLTDRVQLIRIPNYWPAKYFYFTHPAHHSFYFIRDFSFYSHVLFCFIFLFFSFTNDWIYHYHIISRRIFEWKKKTP